MKDRQLIYGTTNPAKLETMQKRLECLDIAVIGLKEAAEKYHIPIPQVAEDGKTPLENAKMKARTYFESFHRSVFSCDSGLYFDQVKEAEQPGIFVRRVNGKTLSDEEMVDYYTGLARKYGNLTARYKNAVCLIAEDGREFASMDESLWSEPFLLTGTARPIRREGFPLDSFSVDIKTGSYYYDLEEQELERMAVEDGFINFFRAALT